MRASEKSGRLKALDLLLLRNASRVRGLDSAITYLAPFLPGQSPLVALGSEAAASLTVLINLYMDQLVERLVPDYDKGSDSKFLKAMYARSRRYQVLAYGLGIVKSTELFVEMSALHYRGRRGQWQAVLGIEGLKALIRLVMLAISKRPLPANIPIYDPGLDPEEIASLAGRVLHPGQQVNRSGKRIPTSLEDSRNFSLQPPNSDALRKPMDLVRRLSQQRTAAEVLHILRPLIYALLLYKYRAKRRSWTPWVIGVAIELASSKLSAASTPSERLWKSTGLEGDIRSQRNKDMAWWLMRGAMYEHFSGPILHQLAAKLSRFPIINLAGLLLDDFLYLFDEYYFGSATL